MCLGVGSGRGGAKRGGVGVVVVRAGWGVVVRVEWRVVVVGMGRRCVSWKINR